MVQPETKPDKTVGNLITITSSNVIVAACGFLANMYVARLLSKPDFGLFNTFTATATIISMLIDFGLSVALVTFIKQNRYPSEVIYKSVISLKLIISAVLLMLSIPLLSIFYSNSSDERLFVPVCVTVVAGCILSCVSTIQSYIQAKEEFWNYSVLNILQGATKLVAIVAVGFIGMVTLNSFFFAMLCAAVASLLFGFIRVPVKFGIKIDLECISKLYGYSLWIGISSVLGQLVMRLDLYLLGYYKKFTELGIYSAAFQMATVLPIITTSFISLMLPKVAAYTTTGERKKYALRLFRLAPIILLAYMAICIVAQPLMSTVFGDKYIDAASPFMIMQSVFMAGIIFTPLGLLVHSLNTPYILTIMIVGQIVVNAVIDVLLIPQYGAVGAAWGTWGRYIAGFIFMLIWVWRSVFSKRAQLNA
jgi:O-antigen/teichoic acid export membrane protein